MLGQGSVSTGSTDEVATSLLLSPPATVVEGDSAGGAVVGAGVSVTETVSMVVWVSVTGQMVVETGTVTIVVVTESPGHSVTVGSHCVMVWVLVVKMVEVLS